MNAHHWFIVGASSGIGRAIVQHVLERGDRVVASARRTDALQSLVQAHGERLTVLPLDLQDVAQIAPTVARAIDHLGHIDVLVNSAGHALLAAAEEASEAQIHAQMATNLLGAMHLIRAVLPHLRARGAGRIVQLSSEGGQMSFPSLSYYHASKWGIEGFCDALARDVALLGIEVILVEPGHVATDFDANAVQPAQLLPDYQRTTVGQYRRLHAMGKFPAIGDPQRVARAIVAEADAPQPRRRLVLGSDAYRNIHRALTQRLRELEAQQAEAAATDRAPGGEGTDARN